MVNWTAVKIFTGIVLVAMVSIGLSTFMFDIVGNYEKYGADPITPNETSTYAAYNILSDVGDWSTSLSNVIEKQSALPDILQFFIIVPSAIWQGMKMLFSLPAYIMDIVLTSTISMHLPDWVFDGITAIVTFIIVMLILSAIMKWRL